MKNIVTKIILLFLILNINSLAQVYSTSGGGVWDQDSTWAGGTVPTSTDDVVITGIVKANVSYDSLLCKNLTVNEGAVLTCDNYGSYGVQLHVFGDLINNGTINQSDLYWTFGIRLYGDLTNNGVLRNKYIDFVSEGKQYIAATQPIAVRSISAYDRDDIELITDVTFEDNWMEMEGTDIIVPENVTLSFVRTDSAENSIIRTVNIRGGGTLYMENGYYIDDSSSVENIELTGCIRAHSNFFIKENVVLTDTLMQASDNYPTLMYIEEDFVNNGIIMNNPGDNDHLSLYIKKDVINNGTWKNRWTVLTGSSDQTFTDNGDMWTAFELEANVTSATTFQWYKNDNAMDDEDDSYYDFYLPGDTLEYNNLYGSYYCQTDQGKSRIITIVGGIIDTTDFILEQDFDGEIFPPAGWEVISTNTENTWMQNNPASHSFSEIDDENVASALCPWTTGTQDEWLISPSFTLEDKSSQLDFYAGYSTSWLENATMKLHISTDDGASWTQIWECENDNESWSWRLCTIDLSAYKESSSLKLGWQYVGANGDLVGIDKIRLHTITALEGDEVITMSYELAQNYPNPFNPATKISFSIPQSDFVNLSVYNILGEKVATLINENMFAGKYTVEFNANKFASGVYLYRLKTSNFAGSKKMILLK